MVELSGVVSQEDLEETREVVEVIPDTEVLADLSDDEPVAQDPPQQDNAPIVIQPQDPQPPSHITSIIALEAECMLAEAEVDDAASTLKMKKKTYERAVERLRSYIRTMNNDLNRPLFFAIADSTCGDCANKECEECDCDDEEDSDPWQFVSIDELELPKGIAKILKEAGTETIGQLEDLRCDIAFDRAEWPKGIGRTKVDVIEDAVIGWIAENVTDEEDDDNGEDEDDQTVAL